MQRRPERNLELPIPRGERNVSTAIWIIRRSTPLRVIGDRSSVYVGFRAQYKS